MSLSLIHQKHYWPFDDYESERRFRELVQRLKMARDGGVAFFGAGASVPAGFPTWMGFHKEFLAHFGAKPSSANIKPDAMLVDIDYHTNRDEAKALAFVKKTFAAPISQMPPVMRLALATRSFHYFYTTNIDEVIFEAALGKSVAVYPDYIPMDSRFVYLHGRASTAHSVHDALVLGSTGYKRAYSESGVGVARNKLGLLSPYPVIFVGFSMNDPSVVRSLEEITRAARQRQVSTPDGEVVESVSQLSWYILLKAPSPNALGRDREKSSREEFMRGIGVQVIWYRHGGPSDPHRALLEVVQLIQRESRGLTVSEKDPGFVESLLEAEELASSESPTPNQVRRAKAILEGNPRIAAEFLDRVDGLEWFRSLRDAGVLEPKPSYLAANGERHAPYWHSAKFLQRVATLASTEVKDFLLTVDTNNWVAIRQALKILQVLDESSGAALAARVAKWTVKEIAIDTRLLMEVSRTARQLESDGKYHAALALVKATILELSQLGPTVSEGSAARFSEHVAPILAGSESGLKTLRDALRSVLQRHCGRPEQDDIRYSRPAIEVHRMNLMERSVVGLLIDLTRDSLLVTDHAEWRANTIEMLLRSPWPTERRIGVAHCFLRRSDLPVHEGVIITRENLADQHLFHELAKLIKVGLADLSGRAVQVLKDFVESVYEGPSEGERHQYELWAAVLPVELLPQPPSEMDDDEDPDRHLFPEVYYSGIFTPGAPIDSTSFASSASTLTTDQLLALVRDPAAAGVKVTWRHSPTAMWTLLAEYSKEHRALDPLLAIGMDDLGRSGTWRAIEAMPEVAGDDSERWKEVLAWADRMISETAADDLWSLGLLIETSSKSAPSRPQQMRRGSRYETDQKDKEDLSI